MTKLRSVVLKALSFVLMALLLVPERLDSLIITSVLAGDRKFKTISFDTSLIKPLTFEKELKFPTEFRRHRTIRPPKFDIDINIPIKLPLEDEYAYEKPQKPSVSDIFFQTGEIKQPAYNHVRPPKPYIPHAQPSEIKNDAIYADSIQHPTFIKPYQTSLNSKQGSPRPSNAQLAGPQTSRHDKLTARVDPSSEAVKGEPARMQTQESTDYNTVHPSEPEYGYGSSKYYPQEFVPGGYVNLKLSGPSGGPKTTYRDHDRENWAVQMSQTDGAMPYPILNYQQLQNFYGGLGTFTNGLPENRVELSLLEQIISKLLTLKSKFKLL